MPGIRPRAVAGITLMALACGLTNAAQAQFYPGYNPCNTCAQPVAAAPIYQSAAVTDCPCLKPVTETVYQDVQQVEYRPEQKTVKMAKVVTVMEDREVTTYQTVNEPRTVDVTSYINQTVTECQPMTINQSHWQTSWQPVNKVTPCMYDQRPGLMGEMNRLGLAFRNSFTPNYVARREFIPNVMTTQVPVQRVVQVPTTRQVTYNVARTVPVTTVQKVPVQRTVWEDTTVTAMVPVTTTKRVAVGTRTRMAYVGDGLGATASAEPTPTTASGNNNNNQSAGKGTTRLQSSPTNEPPVQRPLYRQEQAPQQQQSQPMIDQGPVATTPEAAPSVIQVAGWRTTRRSVLDSETTPLAGPELSVAQH